MSRKRISLFHRAIVGIVVAISSCTMMHAAEGKEPILGESTPLVVEAIDDELASVRVFSTASDLVIELPAGYIQTVMVYDITGRVWSRITPQGETLLRIGRDQLPSGVLLVEVVSREGHRKTFKIKL
ncbi:MAG: T9SS type A sorting domain-containing protein [Bacteroidales bacterium]|nr:T9SS type A sorting domain-containing protein [Porphyromonas sp.]MDD6934328.1 T9SS type A sorting domain-containing protein [Bacteroidales bacterium]MDY3102144.1 T9SS type A sorting domain-containing protein [Porphyromonas sp.]